MPKYVLAIIFGCLFSTHAWAWQGFNMDNGTVILIESEEQIQMGNVRYFDYDSGEEKQGYLNMYDQNIGLLLDFNSGNMIRVRMDEPSVEN